MVLAEYARLSTSSGIFTQQQKKAADIDGNGVIDANDASTILRYYAYCSTNEKIPFEDFLKNN